MTTIFIISFTAIIFPLVYISIYLHNKNKQLCEEISENDAEMLDLLSQLVFIENRMQILNNMVEEHNKSKTKVKTKKTTKGTKVASKKNK